MDRVSRFSTAASERAYVAGENSLVWRWDGIVGHSIWASPAPTEAAQILHNLADAFGYPQKSCVWFGDFRLVDDVAPQSYKAAVHAWTQLRPHFASSIVKQAFVKPTGVVGAVVTGWARLVRTPSPDAIFDDPMVAFEFLGQRRDASEILATIESLVSLHRSATPIVDRVRALFDRESILSLELCARKLGLSVRLLQKKLTDAETSYRAVRSLYQVERAKRMLERGEPTPQIVDALGYSSAQHFSTNFRAATGTSPGKWRSKLK